MMRMMPTSPSLCVRFTAAGLPPLPSAHWRILAWSVVVSAMAHLAASAAISTPGGFYAKCDRCGVRLGRAGRGRQVLPEDLARRAVAEAAPRGVVEPVGEPPQGRRRERPGLGLARQETPDPAVRVLDGAFLPGAVRVAEVGLHREAAVEGGVGGELGPAVEGDRP